MQAVELGPVPPAQRTQPAADLFLIFAGANIVATTLVTGASLLGAGSLPRALGLVAVGALAGAALVAVEIDVYVLVDHFQRVTEWRPR